MKTTLKRFLTRTGLVLALASFGTLSIVAQPRRDDRNQRPPQRPAAAPAGYSRVNYGGRDYYMNGGNYYRYDARTGYQLMRPPVGMRISVLPVGGLRPIMYGGVPYYMYNNVYYTAVPGGFVVANPPVVVPPPPPPPAPVMVLPSINIGIR